MVSRICKGRRTANAEIFTYSRLLLHKQLIGDIMKKKHRKHPLIRIRQIQQKEYAMKTQRKQTTSGVKLIPYQTKSGTVLLDVSGHKKHHASTVCRCGLAGKCHSQTASFTHAVARSIASTKKNGNPVARYDVQRKQAYLEYPDGKRAYVE